MGRTLDRMHQNALIHEQRKQTRLLEAMAREPMGKPPLWQRNPQPGWYQCSTDPGGSVRYWDGKSWTEGFKP